jgi:hypothetical protein
MEGQRKEGRKEWDLRRKKGRREGTYEGRK